jgi:hypothetical protein
MFKLSFSTYESIPTQSVKLSPEIKNFFNQNKDVFNRHPDLWVKGGSARDIFLAHVHNKYNKTYTIDPKSPRDITTF